MLIMLSGNMAILRTCIPRGLVLECRLEGRERVQYFLPNSSQSASDLYGSSLVQATRRLTGTRDMVDSSMKRGTRYLVKLDEALLQYELH